MAEPLIAEILYSRAAATAQTAGFTIGHGADIEFRRAAEFGEAEIVASTQEGAERDARVAEASRNFALMVKTMIAERDEAYADDADRLTASIIGESTFSQAKNLLCPIFPFC